MDLVSERQKCSINVRDQVQTSFPRQIIKLLEHRCNHLDSEEYRLCQDNMIIPTCISIQINL